jgi:Ca-activated chloride channel family protein
MEKVLAAATEATNVKLELTLTTSREGAAEVASGRADGKYEAYWFASNAYLALKPEAAGRIATSTKIMTSPVAFGLNDDVARRLGWDKTAPTWADLVKAAAEKEFSFGMADPANANSAFTALATVTAALTGGGSLKADDVNTVALELRRFFAAQTWAAPSAVELANRFTTESGKAGTPDGIINYEAKFISLNKSGDLKKPITMVIPSDGIMSADFPFTLVNGVDPTLREAYAVMSDWLRSPTGQQMIMDETNRRPAAPGVKLDQAKFGDQILVELPFPTRRTVLDRLLTSYLNSTRRVTQSIYVLDVSGSMEGERIRALRNALISLAGGDSRVDSSGYEVFRKREKVTPIAYDDKVREPQTITVPPDDAKKGLRRIRAAASRLDTDSGNTATYSALRTAYQLADRRVRDNPGALTSIVLMTDGEDNEGISEGNFRRFYRGLSTETKAVPTFTVKFGPADAAELNRIARLTGGRLFSVEDTRLVTAFRQIRAYQ